MGEGCKVMFRELKRCTSTGSGLLHSWAVVLPKIFNQIVCFRVKKQRSTNFISSRRVEREKDSLPVDVRRLCLSSLFSAFETIDGHFSHRNKWAMALPFRLKNTIWVSSQSFPVSPWIFNLNVVSPCAIGAGLCLSWWKPQGPVYCYGQSKWFERPVMHLA